MTRGEAIAVLRREIEPSVYEDEKSIAEAVDMAIEALQAGRPRGEWICKGDDYAVCSECGGSSGTQFDGVERIPKTTAFCPNCGAKMYGERREESKVEE